MWKAIFFTGVLGFVLCIPSALAQTTSESLTAAELRTLSCFVDSNPRRPSPGETLLLVVNGTTLGELHAAAPGCVATRPPARVRNVRIIQANAAMLVWGEQGAAGAVRVDLVKGVDGDHPPGNRGSEEP